MFISTPVNLRVYPAPGEIYELKDGKLNAIPPNQRDKIITEVLIPVLLPIMNLRSKLYTYNRYEAYKQLKSFILDGSTSEVPKVFTDSARYIKRSNNGKAWRAAKSDPTLIVVSPYSIGEVTVEIEPITKDVKDSNDTYSSVQYDALGFKLITSGPAMNTYAIGGYYWPHTAHVAADFEWHVRSFVRPPELKASTIAGQVSSHFCIDNGTVTSTVANADSACMDVLTAVAELPETAKSVLAGFRMLVDLIRALKKREFNLSKAHEHRLKMMMQKHQLSMTQLQLKLKQSTSPGQKKHWERKIAQANKNLSTTRQRAVVEFTSALASIWMNFRYNIMPMVYTVEDLQSLVESYYADFHTERVKNRSVIDLELDGWEPVQIPVRHKCVIKRSVDPNVNFSSLTQANLLVTAWELIPLSFVVDWFINIGDIISAISSPNLSLHEGATYSFKAEENIFIQHDDGFVAKVKINQFERKVIEPSNHVGLAFNFNLSSYQKLDALALLWIPIRRLIQNSLR